MVVMFGKDGVKAVDDSEEPLKSAAKEARWAKFFNLAIAGKAEAALDELRKSCEGDINVMPAVLDCVRARLSIGEMCGVMREIFGEYKGSKDF